MMEDHDDPPGPSSSAIEPSAKNESRSGRSAMCNISLAMSHVAALQSSSAESTMLHIADLPDFILQVLQSSPQFPAFVEELIKKYVALYQDNEKSSDMKL